MSSRVHPHPMPGLERRRDRADRRAEHLLREAGLEIRNARLAAGLSQRTVATSAGMSQPRLSIIERGRSPGATLRSLVRLGEIVGLELSVRAFAAGQPVRDAAHLRLLRRFHDALGGIGSWRYEVPIDGRGRAWDAVVELGRLVVAIEAETRLYDLQALLRRLELKRRDGSPARLILVVADTRWNRSVVAGAWGILATTFPADAPRAVAALQASRDPGANALILI